MSFAWAKKEKKDSEWVSCSIEKKCYEINLDYVLLIKQELEQVSFQLTDGHLTCNIVTIQEGRQCVTEERIELLEKGTGAGWFQAGDDDTGFE